MEQIFILYLLTDFGPGLVPRDRKDVLSIYETMELCETAEKMTTLQITDKEHMRMECRKVPVVGAR